MNFAETNPQARAIAVYLEDSGGPVTGFSPAAGDIKVSLSGAVVATGGGTWTELSGGFYVYEASATEARTQSYVALIVQNYGGDPFVWVEDIGQRIAVNEGTGLARRIPIYLTSSSVPVTGVAVSGETTLAINGAAFTAASGSFGESGLGLYYYQAALADVDESGIVILRTLGGSHDDYAYTQTIVSDGEDADEDLTPIPAPYTPASPEYVDHVAAAIGRLCEYSKRKVA